MHMPTLRIVLRLPSPVALLAPRVAVIVIAAHLPEARAVLGGKLDALQPLGTLPEIEPGNDHAHRTAVLAAQGLALPARGEKHVAACELGERHVGGVAVVALEDDVPGLGLGSGERQDVLGTHPLPTVVVARPGGHAMNVGARAATRQGRESGPLPARRAPHQAVDREAPARGRQHRLDAEIEHRPVLDLALAGRQALLPRISALAGQEAALARPFLLAGNELLLDAGQEAG